MLWLLKLTNTSLGSYEIKCLGLMGFANYFSRCGRCVVTRSHLIRCYKWWSQIYRPRSQLPLDIIDINALVVRCAIHFGSNDPLNMLSWCRTWKDGRVQQTVASATSTSAAMVEFWIWKLRLLMFFIRGNDEFERVWLKARTSVSWRGKVSHLQPWRMYPLFEITNQSEPHIMN